MSTLLDLPSFPPGDDNNLRHLLQWSETGTPAAGEFFYFGPGLAQMVERLAHRYSESMSSNPSNLTSATVRGDRTGSKPAAKRLASVAPEVDLGEHTLHSPEIQNRGTSGPKKGHVSANYGGHKSFLGGQ